MKYYSTRDKALRVPFSEALLGGLAPDGGLYLPDSIPVLPDETWKRATSFADLALQVLSPWLGAEIHPDDLAQIVEDAFVFEVPLVELSPQEKIYVLELFHGSTLSFKDFGARFMARAMGYFLKQQQRKLTILVATSGDTGSAVADGFASQEDIDVVLLYPKGKVSPVQERQLIVKRPGVRAFAIEGTFDDCQRMVKAAFVDEALGAIPLSSANSINIGRLLPQSLYYLWAIGQGRFEEVNYCVPCGNLGNLTGGVLAQRMGAPIHRFIAGHNANDFFPRYLQDGAGAFKASVATLSNAMDVGAPSNFERLQDLFSTSEMVQTIWGVSISDKLTMDRMNRVYEDIGYIADPHTAVGLEAAARYRASTRSQAPIIVLSTAHPAKFPDVVQRALGRDPVSAPSLEALWHRPVSVQVLPPSIEALREVLLASL